MLIYIYTAPFIPGDPKLTPSVQRSSRNVHGNVNRHSHPSLTAETHPSRLTAGELCLTISHTLHGITVEEEKKAA